MKLANGKVTLHAGDCLEVLAALAENSIDAVVTDPPYHFTSIVKRFGKEGSAPAQYGTDGAFARASRGFMGKEWDGGDIAFRPDTWALVWRVLKPGAHLVAFGAPKNYHRLACAIEDAGFEIRDSLMWVFGSGFPKSLDISKQIDKRGGADVSWFGPWFRKWREENGVAEKQVAALFPSKTGGLTGCVRNWELGLNLPTPDQFNLIRDTFNLPFGSIFEAEREIVGFQKRGNSVNTDFMSGGNNITAPATDDAKQWQGWGTALKPAYEPIVLARKPLSEGTVAANVLRWGTGAINIDACRIESEGGKHREDEASQTRRYTETGATNFAATPGPRGGDPAGRWPANLCHDGSQQVLDLFPETAPSKAGVRNNSNKGHEGWSSGTFRSGPLYSGHSDSGSAARFFYSPKASKHDRAGSKHPTVKPVNLMRWLVRMVTPPGGTVLDPFAGSGTTGLAAVLEGFEAQLIEREAEYQADIQSRFND